MSEKCGDLEDVEVKITVCGEEYDVLYRPGECLVFRPQDLIKLFPVKGLDKVEVPLEVLHQLASCLEEVSRAKKKPKKRLKLSSFRSVVADLMESEEELESKSTVGDRKGDEKKPGTPDLEIEHITGLSGLSCPQCSSTDMPFDQWKKGFAEAECEGCNKRLLIRCKDLEERWKHHDKKLGGPVPERMSSFYAPEGIKLSDGQQRAVVSIINSRAPVVVLTGLAGSGKSLIIRALQDYYNLTTSATTGRAAINVGGVTIDCLTSLNRDKWETRNYKFQERAMEQASKKIIVDECSMIGKKMGDFLFDVGSEYRRQWIFVGDFGQAAPVKDGLIIDSKVMNNYEFVKLEECHRQEEGEFLEALNEVRVGLVSDRVEKVFSQCIQREPPSDDRYIRMYATNNATDAYNVSRLKDKAKERGVTPWTLRSNFLDGRKEYLKEKYPRSRLYAERKIEDSRLAHGDQFVVGAKIVFTVNDTDCATLRRFVNGDTGVITGAWAGGKPVEETSVNPFEGKVPEVERVSILMDRTGEEVDVHRITRETKDALGDVESSVTGFPFKLGYALTIHKAQGMTVDRAWVDMDTILRHPEDSRCGLAYVALSRVKTLEGLKISAWRRSAVVCESRLLDLM